MIDEAEARRRHLADHLAGIDGSPRPTRTGRADDGPPVRGLRAFRHRNYQLFFGGQLISLIGTWMQQVAQAWPVLELTNDAFWLGVVAAAQFVPVMVFGLFGGVLADVLRSARRSSSSRP